MYMTAQKMKKSNILPSERQESTKRLIFFKRKLCEFIMHLEYR